MIKQKLKGLLLFISILLVLTTNFVEASYKDYIILLVSGTGVNPKTYSDNPFNDRYTNFRTDEIIGYLVNELHISSSNIYTYGFTASDTDLKQKVTEFGIKNYKNPAAKDKKNTGVEEIKEGIQYGNSQVETSYTAKTGTIKTAAVKDGVLSEDATVPSAYLPKKIITISYGDGAQVVRGYLNSNELLKNGVFRNLNGTDFINEKVLENIKKTQDQFEKAKADYENALTKANSVVGEFQDAWTAVSTLDPAYLDAAAELILNQAVDEAKAYASLELDRQITSLQDQATKEALAKLNPVWENIILAEAALAEAKQDIQNKQKKLQEALQLLQRYNFDNLCATAENYLNKYKNSFNFNDISQAIFVNPQFSSAENAQRMILLTLLRKLIDDAPEKGFSALAAGNKTVQQLQNVIFIGSFFGNFLGGANSVLNGISSMKSTVRPLQDAAKTSIDLARYTLIAGTAAGKEKGAFDAVDRLLNYTDNKGVQHGGWENLRALYQILTAIYVNSDNLEKTLSDFNKLNLSYSGLVQTAINNADQINKIEIVQTFGWNIDALYQETSAKNAEKYKNNPALAQMANVFNAPEMLSDLGQGYNPISMYFTYARIGIKALFNQKIIKQVVYDRFARYFFTADNSNVSTILNTVPANNSPDPEKYPNLKLTKTDYKELAVKNSVGLDKSMTNTLQMAKMLLDMPGVQNGVTNLIPKDLNLGYDTEWMLPLLDSNFWALPNWDLKLLNMALTSYGGMFNQMGDFAHNLTNELETVDEFRDKANQIKTDINYVKNSNMEGYFTGTLPVTIASELFIELTIEALLRIYTGQELPPMARGVMRLGSMSFSTLDLAHRVNSALDKLSPADGLANPKASGLADELKKALYKLPDIQVNGVYEEIDPSANVGGAPTSNSQTATAGTRKTFAATSLSTTSLSNASSSSSSKGKTIIHSGSEAAPLIWPDYDLENRVLTTQSTNSTGGGVKTISTMAVTYNTTIKKYLKRKRDIVFKDENQLSGGTTTRGTAGMIKTSGGTSGGNASGTIDLDQISIVNPGNGNTYKLATLVSTSNTLIIRGTFDDFTPGTSACEYSFNFSGWTPLNVLNDYGHFELGPLTLSEGQNLVSFKMSNAGGYSTIKQLKILKTSISVQPLLDNLVPTIDSYINKRDIKLHLAYQNMKHSADIATKIWLDELKVFKAASNGIASPAARNDGVTANATVTANTEPMLIVNLKNNTNAPNGIQADRYSEKLIIAPNSADHLNRLEADYNFTVTQDGKYMVQAKAVDEYGTSSFLRYEFTVDTTPPTVEFILANGQPAKTITCNPEINTDSSSTINIGFKFTNKLTDNLSAFLKDISYQVTDKTGKIVYQQTLVERSAGDAWFTWNGRNLAGETCPDGRYELQVNATDQAGNQGNGKISLIIDKTPPKITEAAADKPFYNSNDKAAYISLKTNEPVKGFFKLTNTDNAYAQNLLINATSNVGAGSSRPEGYIATLNIDLSENLPDGKYTNLIYLTDDYGNIATQNLEFTIKRTPPIIQDFTVLPLILSSKDNYKTQLNMLVDTGTGNASAKLEVFGQGNVLKDSFAVRIENNKTSLQDYFANNLPKGAYHFKLTVEDSFGNTSVSGMDITKDGASPEITYPVNNQQAGGIIIIKGRVPDPDLTNTKPVEKFQLLYKAGSYDASTLTKSDLASFTGYSQNAPELKVPQRYRKGSNNSSARENEGTVEVIINDTLGYLDTTGLPKDQEYTIVLAVYEKDLGLTGFTSAVVFVPDQTGSSATTGTATSMGSLEMDNLPATFNITTANINLPITFRLLNGKANVALEIVNQQTNKVVFNQQISDIFTPAYIGAPASANMTHDGIYLFKDQDYINLILKTTTPKNYNISILPENGNLTDITGFSSTNANAILFNETITGTKTIRFKNANGKTVISVLPSSLSDNISEYLNLKDTIFLGKTLQNPASSMITLENTAEPTITINWDGKLANTDGFVDNGTYLVRAIAEGTDGNGYQEQSKLITVNSAFKMQVTAESNNTIDPYTAAEIYSLKYIVNKSSKTSAWLTNNQTAAIVCTLKSAEITHPTDTDNPYEIAWTGDIGQGQLAPEGNYTLTIQIVPNDNSPTQTITRQIRLQSKGFNLGTSDPFASIGQKLTLNNAPIELINGKTGFLWKAQVSGELYPPLPYYYQAVITKASQKVTEYPYQPFVTMGHRWFEKVKLRLDAVITVKVKRSDFDSGFCGIGGKGWYQSDRIDCLSLPKSPAKLNDLDLINYHAELDNKDDQENIKKSQAALQKYVQPLGENFTITQADDQSYTLTADYIINDQMSKNCGGKPRMDILSAEATIHIKAPDNTLIETITSANISPGLSDVDKNYHTGEKQVTKINPYYQVVWEKMNDGSSRQLLLRIYFRVKLEEPMAWSRLNNRYFPWFGLVNKNSTKEIDFKQYFDDQAKLGFPGTQFFALPNGAYTDAKNQVYSTGKDSTNTPITTSNVSAYENKQIKTFGGSSYQNYLEGERFELLVVNQDINNQLPADQKTFIKENLDAQDKNCARFKISTNRTAELLLDWPLTNDSQGYQDALKYNAAVKPLIAAFDSKIAFDNNQKAKNLDTLNFVKPTHSDGTFNFSAAPITYFSEINLNEITSGQTTFNYSGTIYFKDGTKQTLNTFSAINSDIQPRLPKNVLQESKTVTILNKTDNLKISKDSNNVIAETTEASWRTTWQGSDDDYLKAQNNEFVYKYDQNFIPPIFQNQKGNFTLLIRDGYQPGFNTGANRDGLKLLYWKDSSKGESFNPNLKNLAWTKPQILDLFGRPNNDIEIANFTSLNNINSVRANFFEVQLKQGNKQNAFIGIKTKYAMPNATAFIRQDSGWQTIEKPTTAIDNTIGVLNTKRLNGKYSLKIEDTANKQIYLKDFYIGTLVPAHNNENYNVFSPYGRVKLTFPPRSFDNDTLVTVTAVKLNEVHVSNMPDISDLDFMPIVEIMPSADFSTREHRPTLLYKYTKPEYDAIKSGNYPGLNSGKGIDLDKVNIWNIGKTGILEKAVPVYSTISTDGQSSRWVDIDQDGKLGSAGDVYQIAAELNHFSTYAAIEGFVPTCPILISAKKKANTNSIELKGLLQLRESNKNSPELGYIFYKSDNPNFLKDENKASPEEIKAANKLFGINLSGDNSYEVNLAKNEAQNNLELSVKNFPLNEGKNYIFLTYPKDNLLIKNRPYAMVEIERDTLPPTLNTLSYTPQTSSGIFFSPNADGTKDELTTSFYPSEPLTAYLLVMNNKNEQLAKLTTEATVTNNPVTFTWSGAKDASITSKNLTNANVLPNGSYNLVMWATDEAGNTSAQQTQKIILDNQKPVIEFTQTLAKVSLNKPQDLLKIRFTDNAGLGYGILKVLGRKNNNVLKTINIPLKDLENNCEFLYKDLFEKLKDTATGTFNISLEVHDLAENIATASCSVMLDSLPPSLNNFAISATTFGAKQLADGKLQINFTVTDNLLHKNQITLSVFDRFNSNEQLITQNTGITSLTILPEKLISTDGTHYLLLKASDGLNETSLLSPAITIDQTPPTVNRSVMTDLTFSPTKGSFAKITKYFSKNIASGNIQIIANGKIIFDKTFAQIQQKPSRTWQITPADFTFRWSPRIASQDGVYQLQINYQDAFDNQAAPILETLIQDSQAPTLNNNPFTDFYLNDLTPSIITLNVADNLSPTVAAIFDWCTATQVVSHNYTEFVVNTDNFFNTDFTNLKLPPETNGKITLRLTLKDAAGNEKIYLHDTFLDTKPPQITLSQNPIVTNQPTLNFTVQIQDTDSDQIIAPQITIFTPQAITYDLQNAGNNNWTTELPLANFSEKNYPLLISAQDPAGHLATQNANLIFDCTAPSFNANVSPNLFFFADADLANHNQLNLNLTAMDNCSTTFNLEIAIPSLDFKTAMLINNHYQHQIDVLALAKQLKNLTTQTFLLKLRLQDQAGNSSESTQNLTLFRRIAPPNYLLSDRNFSKQKPVKFQLDTSPLQQLLDSNSTTTLLTQLVRRSNELIAGEYQYEIIASLNIPLNATGNAAEELVFSLPQTLENSYYYTLRSTVLVNDIPQLQNILDATNANPEKFIHIVNTAPDLKNLSLTREYLQPSASITITGNHEIAHQYNEISTINFQIIPATTNVQALRSGTLNVQLNTWSIPPADLPNGDYKLILNAKSPYNLETSKEFLFTIDGTSPQITIAQDTYTFNRVQIEELKIPITLSEANTKITHEVYDQNNQLLGTLFINPNKFTDHEVIWNGKKDETNFFANGLYILKIIAQDRAGNISSKEIKIQHEANLPALFLDTGFASINPQKNPQKFNLKVSDHFSWVKVVLKDDDTKTIKRTFLNKENLTSGNYALLFDGKDDNNNYLKDGSYFLEATGQTFKDANPIENTVHLMIKTQMPAFNPVLSRNSLRKNKARLEIKNIDNLIDWWQMTAQIEDSSGKIIETYFQKDLYAPIVIPDGKTSPFDFSGFAKDQPNNKYTLRLSVADDAQNKTEKTFDLDYKTEVTGDAKLTMTNNFFTPNNDGVNDELPFSLQVNGSETEYQLTLEIQNEMGKTVKTLEKDTKITTGQTKTYSWNSDDDNKQKSAEGCYQVFASLKSSYNDTWYSSKECYLIRQKPGLAQVDTELIASANLKKTIYFSQNNPSTQNATVITDNLTVSTLFSQYETLPKDLTLEINLISSANQTIAFFKQGLNAADLSKLITNTTSNNTASTNITTGNFALIFDLNTLKGLSQKEASYNLEIKLKDSINNETKYNIYDLIIDNTPPAKPIFQTVTNNFTNKAKITPQIQSETNSQTLLYCNNKLYTQTTDLPLEIGTNNIYAIAQDAAGNLSPSSDVLTMIYDNICPNITSVNTSSGNIGQGEALQVTVNYSENMDTTLLPLLQLASSTTGNINIASTNITTALMPANLRWLNAKQLVAEFTSTANLCGNYQLQIGTAQDLAGNQTQITNSLDNAAALMIDTIPPSIEAIIVSPNFASISQVTISVQISEPVDPPHVTLNSNPIIFTKQIENTYFYSATISANDPQGYALIQVTAADQGHNQAVSSNQTLLVIDTLTPSVDAITTTPAIFPFYYDKIYIKDNNVTLNLTFNEEFISPELTSFNLNNAILTKTTWTKAENGHAIAQLAITNETNTPVTLNALIADKTQHTFNYTYNQLIFDHLAPQVTTINLYAANLIYNNQLGTTINLQTLNQQELKIRDGELRAEVFYSEPVTTPNYLLETDHGLQKPAQLIYFDGTKAIFKWLISATDFKDETSTNDITAHLYHQNTTDLAGNELADRNSFTLDFQAPKVTEHWTNHTDEEGVGIIKPYGVAGFEDRLQFSFRLSEPAYVPQIMIYQIRPKIADVLVKTIQNFATARSTANISQQLEDEYQFTWDGTDNQGKLVAIGKENDFYYVKITTYDKAGNQAMENIDGYIKVRNMDLGIYLREITPSPSAAIKLNPTITFITQLKISNYSKTKADFKDRFGRDLTPFADLSAKVGKYNLNIYGPFAQLTNIPASLNSNAIYQTQATLNANSEGTTLNITWTPPANITDGYYLAEIKASDNAGNIATHNIADAEIATFLIDNTAPSMPAFTLTQINRINHTETAITSQNSITLTDTATDNYTTQDKLRYYAKTNPTQPWQAVLNTAEKIINLDTNQAQQTISYIAVDEAGNTSNITQETIIYDPAPPTANLNFTNGRSSALPGINLEASQNITAQLTITEPYLAKIETSLNDTPFITTTNTTLAWTTAQTNGDQLLTIRVTDWASNITNLTKTIYTDSEIPSCNTIEYPNFTNQNTAFIKLNFTDASYPVQINYALNNNPTMNFTVLTDKDHSQAEKIITLGAANTLQTISITATDRLGNTSSNPLQITYDTTAPTCSASGASTAYQSAWPIVTATFADPVVNNIASNLAELSYNWDNGPSGAWTYLTQNPTQAYLIPTNNLGDGSHVLYLQTKDQAGNISNQNYTYLIDTTPPQIDAPVLAGMFRASDLSITWGTITEAHIASTSYSYQIDNNPWVTLTPDSAQQNKLSLSLTKNMRIQAKQTVTDLAGNTTTQIATASVQNSAPTIKEIILPTDIKADESTANFIVTVDDFDLTNDLSKVTLTFKDSTGNAKAIIKWTATQNFSQESGQDVIKLSTTACKTQTLKPNGQDQTSLKLTFALQFGINWGNINNNQITIQAEDNSQSTALSENNLFTLRPKTPTNFNVTTANFYTNNPNGELNFSWDSCGATAQKYLIYRDNYYFTEAAYPATTYKYINAEDNCTHSYTIKAINNDQESDFSLTKTIHINDFTPPTAVKALVTWANGQAATATNNWQSIRISLPTSLPSDVVAWKISKATGLRCNIPTINYSTNLGAYIADTVAEGQRVSYNITVFDAAGNYAEGATAYLDIPAKSVTWQNKWSKTLVWGYTNQTPQTPAPTYHWENNNFQNIPYVTGNLNAYVIPNPGDGTHTLTISATDNIGIHTTQSFSYMIDTTPPDFGLYIWWGSNTRSFYLDHSTARGYTQEWQGEFSWTREYSWDGAPFQVINYSQGWGWYTPDFSRPTDHGTHTLYFKGTDALGNTQTKSYTIVDPTYISTSGQPITTEELHLISPSQNQQVLTNKPTFTWKIPTTSILLTDKNYKIELKKDVADTETRFTLPDKEINPLSLEIKTSTANQLSYTLSWKDTLTPGSWLWQVSDISNKSTPILSPAGSFEVIPALEIEGVINYPNPFKHKTKIRYKLAKDVDELIIRIFTVSGGLVRELSGDTSGSSLSAEYHDVEWDGCNEYGEAVLNGVYRYKVIAKTASEHKETSGKMIKLR